MGQDDFEQLRRLLALKRHEQPQPGYFNDFSAQIIARIKAGEQAGPYGPYAWLQRLWAALDTRPALMGAFGAAACAFVIVGVIFSESTVPESYPPLAGAHQPYPLSVETAMRPVTDTLAIDVSGGTNLLGSRRLGDSLFDSVRLPAVTPVSLAVPVGN